MPRIYSDWIEACADASKNSPVPAMFRRWAAISAVAGALGRKCWYDAHDYKIRANLYVVLVAPPGHNKSVAIDLPFNKVFALLNHPVSAKGDDAAGAEITWRKYIPDPPGVPLRLLGGKLTPERLCQLMAKVSHPILDLPDSMADATVTVRTTEFGTYMTRNDQFLQVLMTEGWDASAPIEYQTKNMGEDFVHGACINWIACATPSQFVENLPANAAEQGLLSRIIPVNYGGAPPPKSTRAGSGVPDTVIDSLAFDLGQISAITGEFDWAPGVEEVVAQWLRDGERPKPQDPMMQEYCARRLSHLIKVCMAVSASRRSTRKIHIEDWNYALTALLEVEQAMPALLRRFGMSDAGKYLDDLVDVVRENGGRMSSSKLKREAFRICKSISEVETAIKLLVESRALEQEGDLYSVA